MSAENTISPKMLAGFGKSVEERIVTELGAKPSGEYEELQDIKNLAGESTGYARVFVADKLLKAACMSVNVMPGGRYFNIHIIPEAKYNIPRFGFEGMVTTHGSQISMDCYPDIDLAMHIKPFLEQVAPLVAVYDEAKKTAIDFQPSRLAHMRALCSPLFLNSPRTTAAQLPEIEALGNRYFDEWVKIYHAAQELDEDATAERIRRREHFTNTIIELDPDRDLIVQVYGEEVTCAIEAAMML